MPFVIHSIGERLYGMWALIGTFMGYYGYMDFGLSIATQRFMAGAIGHNDTDELNRLFNTSLTILAVLAGAAVVITIVIAAAAPLMFVDSAEVETFRAVILVLALNIAVTLVMAPINGLITGTLRYDVATYVELGKLVFRTALIIYFIGAGYSILALAVITLLSMWGRMRSGRRSR